MGHGALSHASFLESARDKAPSRAETALQMKPEVAIFNLVKPHTLNMHLNLKRISDFYLLISTP